MSAQHLTLAGGGRLPAVGLAVLTLSDIPEETRTPAMFLVLDRLWEHLRQREGRRKTFLIPLCEFCG